MTVNAKIRAVDYNSIRNQINLVLGAGLGNSGYGQTSLVTSSTVSESTKVSIGEWNRLKADISTCWRHIYNTNPPSITTAVVNETVRSNATTSPYTQYQTLANDITNNRFQTPPNNIITAKGTVSRLWPGAFGNTWKSTLQSVVTVSWPTGDAARHFFNSGGEIRFNSSRSGGTVAGGAGTISAQNNEWTNFLANTVQTRAFGGNKPVTGTGSLTGTNFFRLSNTYSNPWYSATAGGAYSLSTFRIWARALDIANNSSGGATTIEFLVEWIDDHVGVFGGPDGVDGTLTLSVSELRAAGEFSIETANVNIGRIEPAGVPANSTYAVSSNFSTINENQNVTFTINTTNVPNGTQLYWSVAGGPGFTAADFSDGAGSGSFTINNNTGSIVRSLAADYVTEGAEFFILEIRINSVSGQIVATSPSVAVNDTATTFLASSPTGTDLSQVNVRDIASLAGWDGVQRLEFTIPPDGQLTGNYNRNYNGTESPVKHRSVAALLIQGSFPNGLTIINKGQIVGTGGEGGQGGDSTGVYLQIAGRSGLPGIVITSDFSASFLNIWNYGQIAGGGGGGGPGGHIGTVTGGGGGGGAPYGFRGGSPNGSLGFNGSFFIPGNGGDPSDGYSKGGRGGLHGQNGDSGTGNRPGNPSSAGGAGGPAGYAIIGRDFITQFIVAGTQNGPTLGPRANV